MIKNFEDNRSKSFKKPQKKEADEEQQIKKK
jgi:hypothetical protein